MKASNITMLKMIVIITVVSVQQAQTTKIVNYF